MKRLTSIVLIASLAAPALAVRIPVRGRNAPPKTLADQEKQNAAVEQKLNGNKPADATSAQPAAPAAAEPTTAPSIALAKAQADLTRVERKLWAAFEKSDDYVKASTALKSAQDAYGATYQTMTAKLADNPQYAAAVKTQKDAEAELATARANSEARADTAAVAMKVMDAKKQVHKLEADAADQDPTVKDAKAKVTEAKAAVDALRKGFQDTIKADPDYIAAQRAVDDLRPGKA